MGNQAYFVTFKERTEKAVLDALNQMGGLKGISISGMAIFYKNFSPCSIKKGQCYLMTYGCKYIHMDKEFLDGVEGITKRQCRVIDAERVYGMFPEQSYIKKYAEIKQVEYDGEKYVIFDETESDKRLKEKYDIERIVGGYEIKLKRLNTNDYNHNSKSLTPILDGGRYYYFKEGDVNSGDTIIVSDFRYSFGESHLNVFNETTREAVIINFKEIIEGYESEGKSARRKDYPITEDIIELGLNSVARACEGKENVEIIYVKNMFKKEFEKYAAENNIVID